MGVIQAPEPMIRSQRPFSSSHFIFQKCLQHAIRPNRAMSPRLDARGFSSRDSRKRHCGRGVVPPFGRLTPRSGHLTSTSLLPLLHRVLLHGFPATMRALTLPSRFIRPQSPGSLPFGGRYCAQGPGAIVHAASPTANPCGPRPSPDRSPCRPSDLSISNHRIAISSRSL